MARHRDTSGGPADSVRIDRSRVWEAHSPSSEHLQVQGSVRSERGSPPLGPSRTQNRTLGSVQVPCRTLDRTWGPVHKSSGPN
jgi:hypothetical protein